MRVNFYYAKLSKPGQSLSALIDLVYSATSPYDREYMDRNKVIFIERYANISGSTEVDFTQRSKDGPGYSQRGRITADFSIPPEA